MSIGYQEAEDEIFGVANAAWVAAVTAAGIAAGLSFPGRIVEPPNVDQLYGECYFSVVDAEQKTLSRYQGVSLYETTGLFSLQIYSPKKQGALLRTAKAIADAVNIAFCKPSPSGEVWFRKQRISSVTGNETKNQVNVVVTCTFRTVK